MARFEMNGPKIIYITLLVLLLPATGFAQEIIDDGPPEVEIQRETAQLQTELDGLDRDTVDTALIFSNAGVSSTRVACRAFDADGEVVGRGYTHVPATGVRFILASDLANGRDFVGQVHCSGIGRVIGSSVLLAPGAITDLTARQSRLGLGRIVFPVAASY